MVTPLLGVMALMVSVLFVATVVGVAVLAWCPGRRRPLSMAPTLGIAAAVLWLSTVGLVVPPGSWVAVGSLLVAALVLVASAVVWRRETFSDTLRDWTGLASSILVGFVCALPFLAIIASAHTSALVHLSGNHDGFFFTAIPEWLRAHSLIGAPHLTAHGTPPGTSLLGSTWDIAQAGSWRVGSESFTAAVSRASGVDPLNLWFPITLVYLVTFATAAHALVDRLGARGWRAPLIAAVAASSAASLGAVLDQHTPTVLALSAALVLVCELVQGPELADDGAAPLLVAITLATVAAVYTELFALVALPIAALVVGSWWQRRAVDVRWIGAVSGWSVLLAGAPWVRAVHGITGGNSPRGFRSGFRGEDGVFNALVALSRGPRGTTTPWSVSSSPVRAVVIAFTVVLVAGLVAVCWKGRARAFWAALLVNVAVGWWLLGRSTHSGYPQHRFVEWSGALLILGSLLGWSSLAGRLRHRLRTERPPGVARASASVLLVAAVLLAVPGVRHAAATEDDPSRRVDRSFTTMADWVGARDPGGGETTVYARDYFTNTWAPYVLRGQPRTAYLTIYRDYYALDHFGRLAGRRWLVVDRGALTDAEVLRGALVEENERFALIDLDQGPAVVEVPPLYRGRWSADDLEVSVRFDDGSVTCRTGARVLPCP